MLEYMLATLAEMSVCYIPGIHHCFSILYGHAYIVNNSAETGSAISFFLLAVLKLHLKLLSPF